jgi:hypothetical protein
LVGINLPVLYITARRVLGAARKADEKPGRRPRRWWHIWPGWRCASLWRCWAGDQHRLAGVHPIIADQTLSRDLTIGAFSVILLGLINAALAENPLKVGLGLLSILAGFELFYTAVEPTLTIVGLLGLTNLFLALAMLAHAAWASRHEQ